LIVVEVIKRIQYLYKKIMNQNMDPVLKNLIYGDFNAIKSSFKEISYMRDMDRLRKLSKEIKGITEATTLVLDKNHRHVRFSCGTIAPVYHFHHKGKQYPDFAVMKLEFVKNSNECLCELYSVASIFSPLDEEEKGNIKILKTYKLNSRSDAYYLCQCTFCQIEYKVHPREYHAPWFEWVKHKRIDTEKLFREPFKSRKHTHFYGPPKYIDSPNRKMYVAHSHAFEPRMCADISLFSLVGEDNDVINDFDPLVSISLGMKTHWSKCSRYFSTAIIGLNYSLTENYFFLYDAERRFFSIIPATNAFQAKGSFEGSSYSIKYPDRIERFDIEGLNWKSIDDLSNFSWKEI